MKTKLFLLLVIVGLSAYIVLLTHSHDDHEHPHSMGHDSNQSFAETIGSNIGDGHTHQGEDGLWHSHDGGPAHTHQNPNINGNDEQLDLVEADSIDNHTIPLNVRETMCVESDDQTVCEIDPEKDFVSALVSDSGSVSQLGMFTLLRSTNYNEVMRSLTHMEKSNDAFVRESEYQQKLNEVTQDLGMQSANIYCSETLCALSVQYDNGTKTDEFHKAFIRPNFKTSIFASESRIGDTDSFIEKIAFMPGNKNGTLIDMD